jgi:GT2 family glycosyltransferase
MAEQPLPITVVIPAYRRPDMVERAVRSVQAQSARPAELIVVDDASGDETGPRAERLGARVITHDENRGEGAARNTGLEAAAHDWVALLDCDDEWLPHHLETLWPARDGHLLVGGAVLVTGSELANGGAYGWVGRSPRVLAGPADVAAPENELAPSAVMLRRDAVLAAGGFRDLRRAADLDMWIRLLERGSALAIPRITALYHVHGGQVSGDAELMHAAHRQVLDAHAHRPWCTPQLMRRHEGVLAWDEARAARAAGAGRAAVGLRLAAALVRPQRAIGLAQCLARRFRARRLAARLTPAGEPSVAVLPGVGDVAPPPDAVDLRGAGRAAAAAFLLRRPPARAIVPGRASALVARACGVEPVLARRAGAAPR